MQEKNAILETDNYYHIYNRANGKEKLFLSENNFYFFLQQYIKYIHPFVDTFCYCLMPNHFHFMLKVKSENDLLNALQKTKLKDITTKELSIFLSKQFSNLFNSYTKAFNKENNRRGSLFMRAYKRKKITDENYLKKLIHYIHYNPIESDLTEKLGDWKFSSYAAITGENKTRLQREEIITLFGDLDNFKFCHQVEPKLSGID